MDKEIKKCSSKGHEENNAICYCHECSVYMCGKCQRFHSQLLNFHNPVILENYGKDNEIFTGLCKEKGHRCKLEYYCQTHNVLCCGLCIVKLKKEGNGQHSNCYITFIEDIEEEKKENLENNIKFLEDLKNNIEMSINELKNIFEKINEEKEKIKLKIQTIFTNLRNQLNEREDSLLLEVDNKFNECYFSENLIKDSEKLPKSIIKNLEKGKLLLNGMKDKEENKLNSFVNDV